MHFKSFFLICLFVFCSSQIHAQIGDLRNNWAVGIGAGVGLNNVTFNPSVKQTLLIAPTGGFMLRYISEKYFAMICGTQLELNYVQRGWKEKIEENADTYYRTMNYIEIPFLMHIAFGKDHKGARFFLNLGPEISFLLGEKEHMSSTWDPSGRRNEQYGKMAEKKFDYGIIGGGGLEIRTGIGHFQLEGRYYFALGDIYNSAKKDFFDRSAHTTISIRLNYLFDLTK